MAAPDELSLEELEELVLLKKKQLKATWEKERRDWKKKIAPEAEKYGYKLVSINDKPKAKASGRKPNLTTKEKEEVTELVRARLEGGLKPAVIAEELISKFDRAEQTAYNWIKKIKEKGSLS
jgi:DNA invertase Pin-like site-specific DNA recombinase